MPESRMLFLTGCLCSIAITGCTYKEQKKGKGSEIGKMCMRKPWIFIEKKLIMIESIKCACSHAGE